MCSIHPVRGGMGTAQLLPSRYQCPSQAQKTMFLGNVIRAKPHEQQDRSPDSKQEENVECEKQSLLSRPLSNMRNTVLPHSQKQRGNVKIQYNMAAGKQLIPAETVCKIQTHI